MKIAVINGSPKTKDSASGALIESLKSCLLNNVEIQDFHFNKPEIDDAVISKLNLCDVWVFVFPLYVDAIPSHLLFCLQKIGENEDLNHNIKVFGIVNSGFIEGSQNAIAIEILKNFCEKAHLKWGMGIGLGGGGSLAYMKSAPLGVGPKKSLGEALKILEDAIQNNSITQDLFISVNFPRLLYKLGAEMGWKKMIRENGKTAKDLNQTL